MSFHSQAGSSVRASSRRFYAKATREVFWAAVLFASAMALGANGAGGAGALAFGASFLFARRAWRNRGLAHDYLIGAIAEEKVAQRLETLWSWGWTVGHDLAKPGGGNVDHVVHSPLRTFTIDTKRSRWRYPDINQAHRHADWAYRYWGRDREIVPVICVERSHAPAELIGGVYVVGGSRLLEFLAIWE